MKNIYQSALKVWKDMAKVEANTSNVIDINDYMKYINLFQPGCSYFFLFNSNKEEFEFISDEIKEILGFEPKELTAFEFLKRIHPEDHPYFVAFEQNLHLFYKTLQLEQISRYKTQYSFRIKDVAGNYRVILHQLVVIQFDTDKNLLRSIGIHSDISHLIVQHKPILSFIGMDGEPSYYNVPVDKSNFIPSKGLFSIREKEIIKLIVEGSNSCKIAEILSISVHTVHTHRKNILNKSKCNNWIEVSSLAIQNGWV